MSRPPNILVFLTDDHAAWAMGCSGNRTVDTPRFDALARNGIRCEEAYCTSPVCSPARASFLTGLFPSAHGIHDYLGPGAPPSLNLDRFELLPARLQAAGYRTGHVGKWHCGGDPASYPAYDYWCSYQRGQYPHRGEQAYYLNGETVCENGFQSDYLTQQAIRFIEDSDERPWFLFVGLVNTHSPFTDQPPELVAKYRRRLKNSPLLNEEPAPCDGWIRFGIPKSSESQLEALSQYYAAVESIDGSLARVMEAAQSRELLTVYTSDHGHMNGQHGLYTKGNATVPQNFYEESIRVPMLIHFPSRLPGGWVDPGFLDHTDLHATLLEAAGADVPASPPFSGQSRWQDWRASQAVSREWQGVEYGNARMIKNQRWKLIRRYPPHSERYPDELYDLLNDSRERRNCIDEPAHASLLTKLDAALEAWFAPREDPGYSGKRILELPVHNPREPWRLPRPAQTPPGGSESSAIGLW